MGALTNLDAFYALHNCLSGSAVGAFAVRGNRDTRFFLDLSYNRLSGDLGPLATLFNFMDVNLSHNDLRGSVPTRMFQNVSPYVLDTSYNKLQGGLDEFMALTDYVSLNLAKNRVSGSIPGQISDLTRLERLVLKRNALSGSVPEAVTASNGLVKQQAVGHVHGTQRSFRMREIRNFSALLSCCSSASNTFSISSGRCSSFTKKAADFHQAGSITSFANFSASNGLVKLDLSSNRLSGKLPKINNFPKELLLANNGFSEELPTLDSCAGVVERMDLSYNQLSGAIPTIIAEFSFLTHLSLSHNALNDTIPEGIADLRSLRVLDLSWNKLQGTIPAMLGLSEALQEVYLAGNHWMGPFLTPWRLTLTLRSWPGINCCVADL
ncbi:unnamed protein product [Closterium sp. NIES-54]